VGTGMAARPDVVAPPSGFRGNTLTGWGLFFFAVSASAPMAVLAGGIIAAFAGTGVVGMPAAFPLLTAALMLFSVGYVSMARHIRHAGPLYAHVARGLGPVRGVAAATVALLSYNCIQICLYGLFGFTMAGFGLGPWWPWALAAWVMVATFGILEITITAKALAMLLGVELVVVAGFVALALTFPAGGHLDFTPLWAGSLFGDGVGGVLALSVACFVGYESTLAFAEEAVSHTTISRASFVSLLFLGVLYTMAAWAVTAATGPGNVAAVAASEGAGIIFAVLHGHAGPFAVVLASIFLATSVFAAMLSFHQTVARYLFAMTRERLLPRRLGKVGHRSGAPIGGSAVQSALALAVIVVWWLFGLDPMGLFTTLAALAAVGIMSLMVVNCVAAMGFYRRGGGAREGVWIRVGAPLCGAVAMAVVVAVTVSNLHSMTGAQAGSAWVWFVPSLVVAVAAGGLVWGVVVRLRHRDVAAGVGRGEPEPLAVLEHHLIGVEL